MRLSDVDKISVVDAGHDLHLELDIANGSCDRGAPPCLYNCETDFDLGLIPRSEY